MKDDQLKGFQSRRDFEAACQDAVKPIQVQEWVANLETGGEEYQKLIRVDIASAKELIPKTMASFYNDARIRDIVDHIEFYQENDGHEGVREALQVYLKRLGKSIMN